MLTKLHYLARSLHVIAELGVADALDSRLCRGARRGRRAGAKSSTVCSRCSLPRIETHAESFLADPLPQADAYIPSQILHDWDEERCLTILRGIRAAAPPGAPLFVLENLLHGDENIHLLNFSTLSCSPPPEDVNAPNPNTAGGSIFAHFAKGRKVDHPSRKQGSSLA